MNQLEESTILLTNCDPTQASTTNIMSQQPQPQLISSTTTANSSSSSSSKSIELSK